ncbi:MAG TPA: sugar phosphate nucleotidyltransferase [Candidatus Acidoferrum sp.]|jgi:glucose-1-phosphate thymidylyltransferase|nr:sugar phosphate nucleotidyltransferase [Candidatus Acidoferrum sp.]
MSETWGIIPAAGRGSRIQPLAFSKELLPVGSRVDDGRERPRAVSEYLVERMILAGATRLAFVVSPGKADIMQYFGGRLGNTAICYAVQQDPNGLCDALFTALPFIAPEDEVLIGLPDTIWFPLDGFQQLPARRFSFLLFHVQRPQLFDAVCCDAEGFVSEIQVKKPNPTSNWVWGAFRMPGRTLAALHELWCERRPRDEYMGTLVNEYIARGGVVNGVKRGEVYVDVGTLHGYHEALRVLSETDVAVL